MARPWRVVVSCEHGGNDVPTAYRSLFRSRAAQQALASHRGWDPGSLQIGRPMARAFGVEPIAHRVTRLLVEVNRSPGHPLLFSEFSRGLSADDRRQLVQSIYLPHRDRVESAIRDALASRARVVHVSVHTFTPVLNGEARHADVGLLYDPRRARERAFCERWRAALRQRDSSLRVRRNHPYKGSADGLTTFLRKRFGPSNYLGIELEVNQQYVGPDMRRAFAALRADIVQSLRMTLDG